jgi:hypothetical protein
MIGPTPVPFHTSHVACRLISGIFFGGFGAGLLVCGVMYTQATALSCFAATTCNHIISFLLSSSRLKAPAAASPSMQPTSAEVAWSNQHSLEMHPAASGREVSVGSYFHIAPRIVVPSAISQPPAVSPATQRSPSSQYLATDVDLEPEHDARHAAPISLPSCLIRLVQGLVLRPVIQGQFPRAAR